MFKKYYCFTLLFLISISKPLNAQEFNIRTFLLLGVDVATNLATNYTDPLAEGLMYGLSNGWYHTGKVKKPWQVQVSLISNGSFIPSEKKGFDFETRNYNNVSLSNGNSFINLPTIIGDFKTNIGIRIELDGISHDLDIPTGSGLFELNLLPTAFLQAEVGLPKHTELKLRFFPELNLDKTKVGLFGIGAQHEISQWFSSLRESKIALSVLAAYTTVYSDYSFSTSSIVKGNNQHLDLKFNSYLLESIIATKFPVYNAYGGLGYVFGDSRTKLKGTYEIEGLTRTYSYTDPIEINHSVSGARLNFGGSIKMGWFLLNASYTFQGFNNVSLGFNFQLN